MTPAQWGARLTTTATVRSPRLWALARPAFRRYFDSLAPRWDGIVGGRHLDALAAALAGLPPPRRVLDVGTGTGAAAFLLAERYPDSDVVGLDVSPRMVAAARAKTPPELAGRVRFLEGDAAALPFPPASFDLVALANMIPFPAELARVLVPGGTLLVTFAQGPRTPIWVPPERLRAQLARRGFAEFSELAVGAATCLVARRTERGRTAPDG